MILITFLLIDSCAVSLILFRSLNLLCLNLVLWSFIQVKKIYWTKYIATTFSVQSCSGSLNLLCWIFNISLELSSTKKVLNNCQGRIEFRDLGYYGCCVMVVAVW